MKKNIYLICIIVVIIFMGCYVLFSLGLKDSHTEIKNGFNNNKLLKMLEEKYELRIPSDAIFISGYYDNAFQDNAVHITFKIHENEMNDLLINNWEMSYLSSQDKEKYSSKYEYQKQMYTMLNCSNTTDGLVKINFTGRYPGNPIK